MKKKKRILRTVISTVLMCCMLVGDLGSVFATTVDNTEIISEEVGNNGTEQDVQTLSEPIEVPEVDIPAEQPTERLVQEPIEEPKVEVETPVVEEEVPPTEQPPVEETPVEKPQEEQPLEEPKVEPPVGDATVEEPGAGEVTPTESDNWSLDLVFYDSSVDGGKTPLKSIDWDASDGGYEEGTPRVITVQINYKNTNAVTNYEPNDLEISIPNLAFSVKDILTASKILLSANTPIQSGEKWNFFDATTNPKLQEIYKFKNAEEIGTANCEGSIQIQYQFIPNEESPERYEDSCSKSCEKGLTATMGEISSEEILFKVSRTYNHPWNKVKYDIREYASKITSYDGLPANAGDYIWVKYRPWDNVNYSKLYFDPYPDIMVLTPNVYIKGHLPEGCILFDKNLNQMDEIRLNALGEYSSERDPNYFYIGYPKSVYNEENGNLIVENPLELWGRYENGIEDELLSECTIKINLADFEFTYSGNLYGIQKYCGTYKLYYQDIINNPERKSSAYFVLKPSAIYTGRPMTIKIGDDILYTTTKDGTVERLTDDEYKFTRATWNPNYLVNGNNIKIQAEKYDCELWVRYKNQEEYVLYDSFKNPPNSKTWSFTDDVVGFYFLVKDVTESFISTHSSSTSGNYCLINTSVEFKKKDIPESGKLYNFDYLQVYFKDSEDNLILQNEPGLDSYANFITKEQIANFDKDTYGVYLQRSVSSIAWEYYHVVQPISSIFAGKEASEPILDTINEEIVGNCRIGINFGTELSHVDFNDYYKEQYDKERAYKGFELYDLLPEGMEIASTKQQIIDSLEVPEIYQGFYDINFNRIDTREKLKEFVEPEVIITKNWKNTNRTMLKIIVNYKTPVWTFYQSQSGQIRFTYNYSISYDEYLDKGNVWENIVYTKFFDDQTKGVSYGHSSTTGGKEPTVYDNGYLDKDAVDLNENDKTSDIYAYQKTNIIMSYVVSTHQDVSKYVKTDKSNYTSKIALASPDSEYTYKLRVRSGENNITNLIIYDSIEEYIQNPYSSEQDFITAYGNKEHWNGEFLGIDTSNAEEKGYKIKVYYSEDVKAGNLSEDNSWKEYSDSVDKSKVKSLAFEYLDESGKKAIIPANSQTYVLIKMKAPSDDTLKMLAYNGCRTQWVAIDENDKPVDFITGINSNTVKVTVNDRVSVQINKVWEDEENKYNTRPDTVEFIMKKDGEEVDRQTLEKGKTTVTFSGLLVDELSTYTFEEVCPSGYITEGVIYDKVTDTYTATNVLDPSSLVEINGTKTWVGDLESERPESITVNLYRNDVKIDSKVVRASDGWSYDFGKFIKNDPDGNKYVYRVEEESIEGYTASYGSAENGLNIKFNSQCKTESANYDYVAIYYKGTDDKFYRLGMWGGTALAGKVVGVPSKDFWLYWRTDSSNSNYYGFSIDSIESANVEATGTAVRLPDYAVEEISGDTYPDSAFDSYTHGNYGNGVNKMWHYTTGVGAFDIVNTSNMTTIEGTKSWVGDTPEVRPDSITVNLLQDGMKIDSVSTDSSKDWKYSFRVPKWDENGREYVYTVSEEPIDDYEASYYSGSGNGSKITFSADSRTEGASYDYVEIYYEKDGKTYKAGKWGGTAIAGTSVTIPSRDFYLYWRTDGSDCNYYGYRVESVIGVDCSDIIGTVATLPNYTVGNVQSIDKLQSGHNPYSNNENKLMLYQGSNPTGRYDITNTLDNIELRFNKVFNTGTEGSKMELQHDGISFTLYENTLESGYPESFPGTSDEWRKVGELSKYEVGGDIDNFRSEYYIDGLKSNKEYFLVENTDNLRVTYYANLNGGLTDSFNVSTASIEDSCYVVRTGAGIIDNIFLTVYGYSNNTEYKPLYKEDFIEFCLYYGGNVKGTKLHSFLDYISRKYPSIELGDLLQPEVYEGDWVVHNFLETKRISVTKKIKASDINFDNGNPTFIFEARVEDALGFSSKSSESELFNFPVLDIKHVEFTKEYVEANTDAEGYVSKTVYFDRIVPLSVMAVAERVGSRYDCSSVTVDGLGVPGIMSGMGCAEVFNTPFIETNITFTNEKYENQYYSHNSIVVNEIKRNKTSMVEPK